MDLKGVTGPFKKRILVFSDDPLQPRLALSIQGDACGPPMTSLPR
jgi:hypothetical protein